MTLDLLQPTVCTCCPGCMIQYSHSTVWFAWSQSTRGWFWSGLIRSGSQRVDAPDGSAIIGPTGGEVDVAFPAGESRATTTPARWTAIGRRVGFLSRARPAATAGISTPALLCGGGGRGGEGGGRTSGWDQGQRPGSEPGPGPGAVGTPTRSQGDLCSATRVAVLLTKAIFWPELQMQVSTCTIAQGQMSLARALQSCSLPDAVDSGCLHVLIKVLTRTKTRQTTYHTISPRLKTMRGILKRKMSKLLARDVWSFLGVKTSSVAWQPGNLDGSSQVWIACGLLKTRGPRGQDSGIINPGTELGMGTGTGTGTGGAGRQGGGNK